MTSPNNNDIFSEEYNSEETTELEQTIPVEVEVKNATEFTTGENNYTISKPRRIIIKAIIKHD